MTVGLLLMKSVLTPLAKIFYYHLDYQQQCEQQMQLFKKIPGSGTTALIISNEEKEDIMKIVKSLEESGLLIQGISETIKNETKEQKGVFLSILFGTLAASILGNVLAGQRVKRVGVGTVRADENF